jgi:NADH-quinone oxidoreductase subunit I
MSIFSDIWEGVRTTMVGMKITLPYIMRKPVTRMYPHEAPIMPERVRNRLYVNMDDCIGCDQCSRACPVNCITIETAKAIEGDPVGVTSNGKKKALWVTRFDIDIAKCCFCGLCTFPCPTECIKMTDVFEFSEQERNNLIYSYITLTPGEITEKIARAEQMEQEATAKKAAAATAKAAEPAAAASSTPAAPTPAAPATTDPDKAAKLAELQAKMAAAKAQREGGAAPAPAPQPAAPAPGTDSDKAAKMAELQAKMAAAKAKREAEAGGAPAPEPATAQAPTAPEPPAAPAAPPEAPAAATTNGSAAAAPAAPASDDPEKAARIAAMQAKIAEAKARKEKGG